MLFPRAIGVVSRQQQIVSRSLKWRNRRPFSKLPIQSPTARQPSANVPRTRAQLVAGLPPIYPKDLFADIQRDNAAVDRMLVVLDDDPTGTQSVHSLPVLADWSVQALIRELKSPGKYHVVYLNTNSRALTPTEAFDQYEQIARNLKEACALTGAKASVVSRGDSTLRGHFPGDLLAVEKGLGVKHDAWILAPFFQAGGRITAGDVHFVQTPPTTSDTGVPSPPGQTDASPSVTPAGETEFARDAAFGYRSSNLVDWIREKSAAAVGSGICAGDKSEGMDRAKSVVSISLRDLREGGPDVVRERLSEARGGCAVVNAVDHRDLQVFVKSLLEEEKLGRRFLLRTAADFVAVRGAIEPRPLLERRDFDAFAAAAGAVQGAGMVKGGGLTVVGSYVAKTTEQLEHALAHAEVVGVEMRAAEVVGEGVEGRTAFDREVERVSAEVNLELSRGRDVVLYTSRGVPLQGDGACGLVFGERVGAALVACVAGVKERPKFLVSKGGITSSDLATKALGMTRAEVMGQILPGVPVWAMPQDSRWPKLPLVVFPGNVGGKDALLEAMFKLGAKRIPGGDDGVDPTQVEPAQQTSNSTPEVAYPYASGSGFGNRTLDILAEARSRGAAVGAFTVYSLEGIRAVIGAAEATGRSAILQAHPAALGFQRGVPLLSAAVNAARSCTAAGGPLLSVQLDHGDSELHVLAALEAGVDSVMIDGSAMEYDDNVRWTAALAVIAHAKGAIVEAELGRLAGEEDGLCISQVEAKMTDPAKVPDFLERTRAEVLAVTVGNVHGKYANPDPKLDLPRLERIRDISACSSYSPLLSSRQAHTFEAGGGVIGNHGTLLALHGASGLPSSQVRGSIDLGVCKFNVNTEVRAAAVEFLLGGVGQSREKKTSGTDILGLLDGSVTSMRSVIEQKMREFDP